MNNVNTVGRLTRDPELRDTRAGAVCQLRIAVKFLESTFSNSEVPRPEREEPVLF
jgi:single-stranded DNA-binding protein